MSDEKPREPHLPDAVAHSVVPPEPEAAPPAMTSEDEPTIEAPARTADEVDTSLDPLSVEDGRIATLAEEFFPLAWLAMLTIVSVIGVYNAVSRLPNF